MYKIDTKSIQRHQEIYGMISRRPLLVPAIMMLCSGILCYCLSDMLPAYVLCVLSLIVFAMSPDKRAAVFLGYFITAAVVLYCGFSITRSLACKAVSLGDGTYDVIITGVTAKLSGKDSFYGVIDGIRVAVTPGGDVDFSKFLSGDAVRVRGTLEEAEDAGNPGEFDYRQYLRRKGIKYCLYVESAGLEKQSGWLYTLINGYSGVSFALKKNMFANFTSGLDDRSKALVAAICLGDTSLLDDDTERFFRMSDCSHLLAVSGTHFAGFLMVLPYILNAAAQDRRRNIIVYVLCAFLTGQLTGWSESVTRAAVMSCCAYAARDSVSGMCLAAIVMIGANPFAAVMPGFQMSFASACAIKLCSPGLMRILGKISVPESVAGVISPAISSLIGMMPFWIDTGMRLSLMLFLVQLGAVFLAQFACIFFIPGVILGISGPVAACLEMLAGLTEAGSAVAVYSSARLISGRSLLLCLCVFICLSLFSPGIIIRRYLLKPCAAILAVLIGAQSAVFICRPSVRIVFADVGQGDCCLVMTDSRSCLIDGGVYEEGERTVRDLLDYYAIGQVDFAFVSHWDSDHAAGLVALYNQHRIKAVYTGFDGVDDEVESFVSKLDEDNIPIDSFMSGTEAVHAGEAFDLGRGIRLKILFPENAAGGGNEDSLVMALETGTKTVLFTGDIGEETERMLIDQNILPDCDILKVAHHGSRFSTATAFLDAVRPEYAVISVGAGNFYGHPAAETLERLSGCGAVILRTDREGAVICEIS